MDNVGIAHLICNTFKAQSLDPNDYVAACRDAVDAIQRGEDGWVFHPRKSKTLQSELLSEGGHTPSETLYVQ